MTYIGTKLKKDIRIEEIITIHYFEYMKDFVFEGESHDFWELLYVDKGKVSVQSALQLFDLDMGMVIFHKPNEFHAIKSIGGAAPNLIAISFRCHSSAMNYFCSRSFLLTKEEENLLTNIVFEARNAFSTPLHIPSIEQIIIAPDAAYGAEQLISIYLECFLILVYRNHSSHKSNMSSGLLSSDKGFSGSNRIKKIIQYMEFHICEKIQVDDICSQFALSRSALQALFHKKKNCGIIHYFNHMKIERAKEIIRDGEMNLTEIACFLSYSSLQYFSRQFKNSTGMSPLEYSFSIRKISHLISVEK